MRRWETLTALAAVISAVLGASSRLPEHGFFTAGAIVLIAIVALSRLRDALMRRRPSQTDAARRAMHIRESRNRRPRA